MATIDGDTLGDTIQDARTAGGGSDTLYRRRRRVRAEGAAIAAAVNAKATADLAGYYTSAQVDGLLPPLAALRRPVPTVNAEGANVITVDIQITDGNGDPVAEVVTLEAELLDDELDRELVGAFTIAETGDGAAVAASTTVARLILTTSAAGVAQLSVTDVGGASGLTTRLRLTVYPAAAVVGQVVDQSLTFDGV